MVPKAENAHSQTSPRDSSVQRGVEPSIRKESSREARLFSPISGTRQRDRSADDLDSLFVALKTTFGESARPRRGVDAGNQAELRLDVGNDFLLANELLLQRPSFRVCQLRGPETQRDVIRALAKQRIDLPPDDRATFFAENVPARGGETFTFPSEAFRSSSPGRIEYGTT